MFHLSGLVLLLFLFKAKALDSGNEIPVVHAIAWTKAFIPCNVPTPLKDDEASLILWYRMDMPNPLYTLDVRNRPIESALHFPSVEMLDRIYFDVAAHPPVLILSPAQPGDKGDYKCRVDLRRSRTLLLHIRLNIIVLPEDPIIMDEYGQHMRGVIGPYNEGDTLILICDVDGGDPSPSVQWWRGNVLVDNNFTITSRGFVRNEMVLQEVQRSDFMIEYRCVASNTNLTKPKAASVILDLNLLPLDVQIIKPDFPMIAGKGYKITCETTGSNPPAYISWWLDGEKITSGTLDAVVEGSNVSFSDLSIVPKPEDNGRILTCRSANPVLPKKAIEAIVNMNVNYPPFLILTKNVHSDIKEGDDIELECIIKANPWIHNITWIFEDHPLTINNNLSILIMNQTLLLQNVKKEHSGRYRCTASNLIGESNSECLQLQVKFSPVCKFKETQVYFIGRTEEVNLTCEVDAFPRDLSFQWSLIKPLETLVLQSWNNHESNGVLVVSPVLFGKVTCLARNSEGVQKLPCVFKILPAVPPKPPLHCLVVNETAGLLYVECQPGYSNSQSQIFHLEVYNIETEEIVYNFTNNQWPVFNISNLPLSISYVLKVYASNNNGRSSEVTISITDLSPAERRRVEEDLMPVNFVLSIFTGVLAFFIIMTMITIYFTVRYHKVHDVNKK
ncbi:hemicentin-1-like, partial [Stegodyphus dumicola]|uniref:hemicentin-1-like n=1 Tax=Stegodyphus dumicola TaxID=202533 RepID=UPI0015AC4974